MDKLTDNLVTRCTPEEKTLLRDRAAVGRYRTLSDLVRDSCGLEVSYMPKMVVATARNRQSIPCKTSHNRRATDIARHLAGALDEILADGGVDPDELPRLIREAVAAANAALQIERRSA